PARVTCRLWKSVSPCAAPQGSKASPNLQRHQIVLFKIVSIIIRAFAVEVQVGRAIDAAEPRLLFGISVHHDDDHVRRDCAAILALPVVKLPVDPSESHTHPLSGYHLADQ